MSQNNVKIAKQLISVLNEQDYVSLENYVHDDFDLSYLNKQHDASDFDQAAFRLFLELIHDGNVPKIGPQESMCNKQYFIEYSKIRAQRLPNLENEITDIIASRDRVWITANTSFGYQNKRIIMPGTAKLSFKDDKLLSFYGRNRVLVALTQIGEIIIKQDEKDRVKRYYDSLKKMGILDT